MGTTDLYDRPAELDGVLSSREILARLGQIGSSSHSRSLGFGTDATRLLRREEEYAFWGGEVERVHGACVDEIGEDRVPSDLEFVGVGGE